MAVLDEEDVEAMEAEQRDGQETLWGACFHVPLFVAVRAR